MKQVFAYSIATATMAGLLVGGGMKLGPEALEREITGPQILIGGENTRSVRPNDWSEGTSYSTYTDGEVPEYVYGTDWTRPMEYAYDAEFYLYEEDYAAAPVVEAEAVVEEAVFVAPVKISTPPPRPTPVTYPSRDGDILAGVGEDEPLAPTEIAQAPAAPDKLPS